MNEFLIFLPMLTMGLVSSGHCIGMCGGIMGALTMAIPKDASNKRWIILCAYNIGRIASYTLMGLLAGLFAEQFAALGGGEILRVIAGALLIAMGLYLADWWRGLTYLEKLGRYLWVYVQPLGKPLMPVDRMHKALFLGALWGWLPCGLVYSALALAMTQPQASLAAGAMLAFGIGTLPSVLLAGVAAQHLHKLFQQRGVRFGLAVLIIIYGVWTVYGALGHSHHHHADTNNTMDHEMHHDHQHMNHDSNVMPASENSNSSSSAPMPMEHHHHEGM